jgi:hypothetical protein
MYLISDELVMFEALKQKYMYFVLAFNIWRIFVYALVRFIARFEIRRIVACLYRSGINCGIN